MLSEIVRQLGELNFEGNIIPHNWFRHPALKLPNGKVNLNAVVILAEVCYWYRPQVILDEGTGQVVEIRNRFKGDALQRTYVALGEKFGLTKRQSQDACLFLKARGVLEIEYRTLVVEGVRLNNVTFFLPVVEKVRELNGPDTVSRSTGIGITSKRGRVSRPSGRGATPKRETNIENRKENKEIEPPSQKDLEMFRQAGGKFRDEID
jgi:hypothetical protein